MRHLMEQLFAQDATVYLLLFVILFAIFLILSFISRSFKNFFKLITFVRARSLGVIPSVLSFVVSLAIIFGMISFIVIYTLTRSYQVLENTDTIALVELNNAKTADFGLRISALANGKITQVQHFDMMGDQWAVEGLILKWPDWLKQSGMKQMYKLTRVRARYLDIKDELKNPASTWALHGDSKVEKVLKNIPFLPLIQLVPETSLYETRASLKSYQIQVSADGFKILPARK